jgi:DNA-binding MarR family transcriptional regulator
MKQTVVEGFSNILLYLSRNPGTSQRELALRNGISLGKVNSAIKYFQRQGFLEVQTATGAHNRRKFFYYLTPAGKLEQSKQAAEFIQVKKREYERITRELKALEDDIINKLDQRIVREVG